MSWGHVGRHLFVAARNQLFTVNVHQSIPSLQYLCQSVVAVNLKDKELTYDLHLPTKMKTSIVDSYSQIIQVCVQALYIITEPIVFPKSLTSVLGVHIGLKPYCLCTSLCSV